MLESEDIDLESSVSLIAQHTTRLEELHNEIINESSEDKDALYKKLEAFKKEIYTGIQNHSFAPEMNKLIEEINDLQKTIHSRKSTDIINRLRRGYSKVASVIMYVYKPIKPIMDILKWVVAFHTMGIWGLLGGLVSGIKGIKNLFWG